MKIRNRDTDQPKMDMTPMSDVVFQLLAFFIMSFKILSPEGDFNIKMPLAAPSQGTPDENLLPPIKIQLKAAGGGELARIQMGDRDIGVDFKLLRSEVFGLVGADPSGPATAAAGFEVEFDVDYDLHYKHVIDAITAVTGYRDRNDNVVKLIEKVKFAPPHKEGS